MFLMHHGVQGQKWGVRRYQNKDGTRTPEGKRHRRGEKNVFISGSVKTTDSTSPYYRKKLPSEVRKAIDGYMSKGNKILVGEAPGVDSQVQDYLKKHNYDKVSVYTSYDNPRYKADDKWETVNVDSKGYEAGTPEFLREKDIAMTKDADEGLSVILENGGAGATRNNIRRLIEQNKNVSVYKLNSDSKTDDWVSDILKEIGDVPIKGVK